MIEINIDSELKDLEKSLTRFYRKQIPFAASKAINDTLFGAREHMQDMATMNLHKPTPFTLRGFKVHRSKRDELAGVLYIDDIQAKYLKYQIEGGTRRPGKRKLGIPLRNMPRNKYGNVPGWRNKIEKLNNDPNVYFEEHNGISGLWRRYKRRPPKLLVVFKNEVDYKKRFDYYRHAKRYIDARLVGNLGRAIERAIKTAK